MSRVFTDERFDHVVPALVLRKMPFGVAASSTLLSAGDMARRLTSSKSVPLVPESCVQVVPPLVVTKMPAPRTAARFEEPSTVSKKPPSPVEA